MRQIGSTMCLSVLAVISVPTVVWSQTSAFASIAGVVTDDSGAPMPKVTVTAKSPALQVQEVVAATDDEGNYRLLNLPAPGVYSISVTAEGFQTYLREGLNLSVGFNAKVDVTMKVGQVSQSVEVASVSPVIDSVNTAGNTTLQQIELQETPKGASLQELFPMAAGVSMQGKPDVGDSNLAARTSIITYGVLLQPTLYLEGINISTAHDLDTGVYFSSYDIGEAELKTSGNNADVPFAGIAMESVMKSGSNGFHGSLVGGWENSDFQSNNITPALAAQGLKLTNPLRSYYDYEGDVGGRIIRDKLWFYTGLSRQNATQGQIGFVSGPDAAGCWTCGDAPPAFITTRLTQENLKGSYQPSTKIRFVGVWQHSLKYLSAQGAASTEPLPSTMLQHQTNNLWKGEALWVPTNHLVIDGIFGFAGYDVHYVDQPGTDVPGDPSSKELSTGLLTGPNPGGPQNKPGTRYEARGNVNYITGKHKLQFGTDNTWEELDTQVLTNTQSGDYQLVFSKGLPNEILTYNFPFIPHNQLTSQSLFATDSWSIGRRVTLNYGVRWERYHAFYPTQTEPAGQFSAGAQYPGKDILTWKDVVPRVGAAWDVFGNGKTVIKASFGMFGDTMGDSFAATFNPNALVTSTYKWNGPCIQTGFDNVSYNNSSCDASPATLAGLKPSSPNFISAVGGVNELINPNLKQDKIYEYALRFDRQLVPNLALTFGYVRHQVYYLYNSLEPTTISTISGVNTLIPSSAYTVPVVLTDTLTANPVTLFTYPASFVGANQFELVNAPSNRPDTYHTLEVAITKRSSNKWTAQASFWATKNHEWIQAVSPSPNANPFPIDDTWNWEARAFGSYNLPWGFLVSGFYRAQSGIYGQRTEVFSSPLLLQGAVTLRMEPFGAEQGPIISVTNIKVAKNFGLGENRRLQLSGEIFNIFNTSSATSTSYLTGPTYLHTTGIVSPRVGRIGMGFYF